MAVQDVAHVETAEVHRGETSLAGAASGFFLPGGLNFKNSPLAQKWIPDPRTFSRALSSIIQSFLLLSRCRRVGYCIYRSSAAIIHGQKCAGALSPACSSRCGAPPLRLWCAPTCPAALLSFGGW